jgi:fermentation-respiration switch protein FrsA (DUF1100 family)
MAGVRPSAAGRPPGTARVEGAASAGQDDGAKPNRPRWRRLATKALRIAAHAALGYLIVVGILYFLQSRLVYFPTSEMVARPDAAGMDCQDVWLETTDGVKLFAWYVPAEKPVGTVLFCHGNGGNISHRLHTIYALNRLALNVLIFDYRGYGRSEGTPTEAGTYLDAEAAWRHLVTDRGIDPGRIVIHGRSLGGAVAAHLARDHTPGALLLESTFTSAPDLGAEVYWFLPVRWMLRFRYETAKYVRDVQCPVLVVHSRDDDMVPYHHGQAVFQAAPQPKEFLEIRGSHNEGFSDSQDVYSPALRRFLARHLGPS